MKQNYDKNIIELLFHQYFPEKEILSYNFCDGGIENSNFLIITESGRYILKVFESHRHEEEIIRSEVEIMIATRNNGCYVPEVFITRQRGNIIPGPGGKFVMLMEYIDGKKYEAGALNSEVFALTGVRIAQFQKKLAELKGDYNIPETHFFDLKYIFKQEDLRTIMPKYADAGVLQSVWNDLSQIQSIFLGLPQQIIHNDLNESNIIFKDEEPCFIDFSDIVIGSTVQDIAIFLTAFCFRTNWSPEGMREFLRGYETIAQLSLDEKNCIFACVEARFMNIVLMPYFYPDASDDEELKPYILENYEWLKRFHEFGKEQFDQYIPQ